MEGMGCKLMVKVTPRDIRPQTHIDFVFLPGDYSAVTPVCMMVVKGNHDE